MINSETKGNQLFSYTYHLSEFISTKIWDTKRYIIPLQRTCYTIIHKLRSQLDTSSLLLANTNLDGKPHYFDSLYLILRTCLSDIICLYYIIDKEDDNVMLDERITRILIDHLRYIYPQATDEKKIEIANFHSEWFENGKIKSTIKRISASEMVKEINNDQYKLQSARSLEMYHYFSKLEHNGLLSFPLLHNRYEEIAIENDKERAIDAIIHIMIAINYTSMLWMDESDPIFSKLLGLTEHFMSINN